MGEQDRRQMRIEYCVEFGGTLHVECFENFSPVQCSFSRTTHPHDNDELIYESDSGIDYRVWTCRKIILLLHRTEAD